MKTNKELPYVGWICSYVPEEIIDAAGFQPYRITPDDSNKRGNSKYLPANFCPLVKKVVESFEKGDYNLLDGFVIANSCNAMTHLYNVINELSDDEQFVYFLDLPRKPGDESIKYYTHQLQDMFEFLMEQKMGNNNYKSHNSVDLLKNALYTYRRTQELLSSINYSIHNLEKDFISFSEKVSQNSREKINEEINNRILQIKPCDNLNDQPVLLLTGAMVSNDIFSILQNATQYPILPEGCQGLRYLQKRNLLEFEMTTLESKSEGELLEIIASTYLKKLSCPRFYSNDLELDRDKRSNELQELIKQYNIKGVIHHDLGFCDISNYDYLLVNDLFSKYEIPVLRINSELGKTELGQIKTRLEAFCEMELL